MTLDKEMINLGKKGKKQIQGEYNCMTDKVDLFVYVCPFCKELAYEDEYCVFCGAKFEEETEEEQNELKELNHELDVSYENVRLIQTGSSLFEYKNGVLVSHSSLSRPMTKEELLDLAKEMN